MSNLSGHRLPVHLLRLGSSCYSLRHFEGRLRVFILLSLLAASAVSTSAHAEHEEEGWVRDRLISEWRGRVARLSSATTLSPADLALLDDLWFGLNDRAVEIRRWKFEALSYSYELLVSLETNELPALRVLLARLGRDPSRADYDARVAARADEVSAAENDLRARMRALSARATRRLLSLAAFARSGTLGTGRIGSWNPASSESIQSTALDGLGQVLGNLERLGDRPVDLDFLRLQQALLLGSGQHHYSRAGEIMDRDLERGDGSHARVLDHVNRWVNDLGLPPRSSADALESYARLLHLHPFGDSNGRVAEVAKQLLLARLGLPALLTPEKTSIETYRDSVGWGQTEFQAPVLQQLRETIAFLGPFERLQAQGWRLEGASLAGSVLIAEFKRKDGRRAVAVIPRALEARGELPPAPGAIVLAGKSADALKLRLGVDGWAVSEDFAPFEITQAPRIGDLHVCYPLYFRALQPGERGELRFAFHYAHPSAGEVWFNNGGRDYFHSPCRGALE